MIHILPTPKGVLLLLLITLLGLMGIMLVLLLGWTWRRFNARQQAAPAPRTRMPDIWQAGGTRLKVDKDFPRENDDSKDQDEDQDDDRKPETN
jgi:hypothetical protein